MPRLNLAALLSAVLLFASTPSPAAAEEMTFDFADPKGVNGITFVLDSQLEPFVGTGGGITGEVTYDPEAPESFAGSISVATGELKLISDRMTNVMLGADWLNADSNQQITVEFTGAEAIEASDDAEAGEDADAGARLMVKGVLKYGSLSLEKDFEIHATYIPNGGTERGGGSGDLLVLRSEFTVSRYDLGIKPDMGTDKVSEEVWVIVPIAGYSK